jgi:5-methylcytosine-specific restriction endonuclease McrA
MQRQSRTALDPILDRLARSGIRLPHLRKAHDTNVAAHRAIGQASDSLRRARRVAAGGSFTRHEWLELIRAFNGVCGYCGKRELLTADHRTPLARGGGNDIANIIPACGSCNSRKGTKTEEEFRAS